MTFFFSIFIQFFLLYSCNTKRSGNVIKHNLRTSTNERTHFFIKKISLTLYSRKGWCFCGVWVMVGETYTQRGLFLIFSSGNQRVPTLALPCRLVRDELTGWVSLVQLQFSAFCLNLTAWFSSRGLHPVTHLLYPSALIVLPCLLITTCQLVKAHGVIRSEPKIHGIYNITFSLWSNSVAKFDTTYPSYTQS